MEIIEKRKKAMEAAIHWLNTSPDTAFMGNVLQCLSIKWDDRIPTAGIMYDTKAKNFSLIMNTGFFCDKLTFEERQAVLLHELYHVTFKHVFFDITSDKVNKQRLNIAMDLVINQHIKNLPKDAMTLDKFTDSNGKQFSKNCTTETYYDMLEDAKYKDSNGNTHNVSDMIAQGNGPEFDVHGWDEVEGDAKEKLEAVRDLMKRAMHKASVGHAKIPDSVRDMLKEIDSKIQKLDYKAILLSTLKKSMPSKDTKKTWKRQSRRLGPIAQGNTKGNMPKIEVLIDTSGSISIEEANEFLKIVDNFLNVGVEKAMIHLFHTKVYHSQRVKRKCQVEKGSFQSGGTDLTDAFQKVIKSRPDLCIVLTDGVWDMPDVNVKKLPQTVFVISRDGQTDHPMKNIGKTVKYA